MTKLMIAGLLPALALAGFAFTASAESDAEKKFNEALQNCTMKSNVDERNDCIDEAQKTYTEAVTKQ